jgi:L-xylulokinase
MGGYLLGIDAGNTVTKAVLFDRDGRQAGQAARRCAVSSPHPRWAERDMETAWETTADAIAACLRGAGIRAKEVAAVGLAGHSDGLYPVGYPDGGALRPVRPAVLATDSRAHAIVERWRARGVLGQVLQLTGTEPFAASPAALCAWFARHEPEMLGRTRWLLFAKDWLRLRLTGEVATDPTDAAASFCDIRTRAYSPGALALFGLAGIEEKLPPIVPGDAVAGAVTADAAARTGLAEGTPVTCGVHDVDAAATAMGAAQPGMLSMVAGTFSINQVISTQVRTGPRWQARPFVTPGRWLNMSTSPSSASNLEWFVGRFGPAGPDPYAMASAEAEAVLSEPAAVVYLPFLYGSPQGAAPSGTFAGMRGHHSRGHLIRALFEGVVCAHRSHVEALRDGFAISPVARLSGGAARSAVWSQMFADALRLDIEVPDCAETGALGAALIAGAGIGAWRDLDEAAAVAVRIARRHQPRQAAASRFDAIYQTYQDLSRALGPVWDKLG